MKHTFMDIWPESLQNLLYWDRILQQYLDHFLDFK